MSEDKEYIHDYCDDLSLQAWVAEYQYLIDRLIEEMKDQNVEIVALRRLLMKYMTADGADYMKMEIYDALYPQYIPRELGAYIVDDLKGVNPFEEPAYLKKLRACAGGRKVYGHPNICSESLKRIK